MQLYFVCTADNDLYRVLAEAGYTYPRSTDLEEALHEVEEDGALLVLADNYPCPGYRLTGQLLERAKAKRLRLYFEYPSSLPGLKINMPQQAQWERTVVSSNFFQPALTELSILAQHSSWFLTLDKPQQLPEPLIHLVMARVAGYEKAVYGLPEKTYPLLFTLPGAEVLVAMSKLSQFVTARYAPLSAWKAVWEGILTWLAKGRPLPAWEWTPKVAPRAKKEDVLPPDTGKEVFTRSVRWFRRNILYRIGEKVGAIEGFSAAIDYEGRQAPRPWPRADCLAETGMVFAYDWALTHNPASRKTAEEIFDYVWSAPDFYQDDPQSPAYGLVNWYERGPVFYGDDNARVILAALTGARLLQEERWDEYILRCLLANLRTTGRQGFRRNRIDGDELQRQGWRYFAGEELTIYAPHYQAYLWAAYLWAYALTGYHRFWEKADNAIRLTMAVYPRWKWTNGFTQEMARMLLPLSFLLRFSDNAETRGWLNRVSEDLLACMQPCGAIREQLGSLEDGQYPSPQSNEAYGTTEASLIQENGDPACDLLYTTNFAFLGLHEAAAVTGEKRLKEAEERLADFLCRIQVNSPAYPFLDGAWMRSFDYQLWEYWGSSADHIWGAWCVESGWTNSWIATVLAMRLTGSTLFSLDPLCAQRWKKRLPGLLAEMGLA